MLLMQMVLVPACSALKSSGVVCKLASAGLSGFLSRQGGMTWCLLCLCMLDHNAVSLAGGGAKGSAEVRALSVRLRDVERRLRACEVKAGRQESEIRGTRGTRARTISPPSRTRAAARSSSAAHKGTCQTPTKDSRRTSPGFKPGEDGKEKEQTITRARNVGTTRCRVATRSPEEDVEDEEDDEEDEACADRGGNEKWQLHCVHVGRSFEDTESGIHVQREETRVRPSPDCVSCPHSCKSHREQSRRWKSWEMLTCSYSLLTCTGSLLRAQQQIASLEIDLNRLQALHESGTVRP